VISALILGELIADPVQRTTATGKPFGTATVRSGAGAGSVLIGLSTFSATAVEKLLQLRKGDSLAATGTMELNVWTDREGRERRDWRLTASAILTQYEAGKRRKAAQDLEARPQRGDRGDGGDDWAPAGAGDLHG
jgi:single-stranded DNA-binding protein